MAKREQAQAPVVDEALDRDPAPDPEWLAGLPPDARKAHDRMEAAREGIREAEERRRALTTEARTERDRVIGEALEVYHREVQRAAEEYTGAAWRADAAYRQARQAATEQYDQAQMQYDQALRAWHDAHNAYIAGVAKEG